MNSAPLVSVIIPIHNEAEFLAECIESVFAQTYQNWDCTIVDNCSTDGSVEIARRYATKDGRLRVVETQEFLRVIPNHNFALRQISGTSKYCKVVFGDDWLFPECLERMVTVAESQPSVGIVGGYSLQDREVKWAGLPYERTVFSGREICRRLFLDGLYVFGSATSLLYRADLVRSRSSFYNEANLHADSEVCIALLKTCDFGFVHQVVTYQRVRPASLSTMSSDMSTYRAGMLHDLVTHGQDFLSHEEFESCLNGRLAEYYESLAGSLVRGRDKNYWEYHKRKLAEAGVGFSRVRLARVILAKVCDAALNPKHSVEKFLKVRNDSRLKRSSSETPDSVKELSTGGGGIR
jgi:glycosyltransferase involved in cell wall biosynthesis